jgi:DNA-binding phage protein
VETRPFDPAQYLDSEEAISAYLADARQDGAEALAQAAEVVARARRRLSERPEHRRNVSSISALS